MNKFNNRELSWLSFNERVLMEALDKDNPLLERLRFVAIFSSNLDEFFMVRVAGIQEQISANYEITDLSGLTPLEQLTQIKNTTNRLSMLRQNIFDSLKEELKSEGVYFADAYDEEYEGILEAIFLDEIMAVVTPVTIDLSRPFPFIYSKRICIIAELTRGEKSFISLIMLPETLRRIYRVRKGKNIAVFTAEDIIKKHLHLILKGYEIKTVSFFRVTRDEDLGTEEESADLIKTVEHLISRRKRGDVSRIEVADGMPKSILHFLQKMVGFSGDEVQIVKGTLDLTFLTNLSGIRENLIFPKLVQKPVQSYSNEKDIFEQIRKGPLYFYRPYNSFSIVCDMIEKAAKDENVLAIKLTLYRTNKNSRIVASLLEAAKRGKQVSVVVELKARFDEERNIEWAKNLEKAGCLVTYGIVGLKVHAKCMLIVRREEDRIVRYTHIATGNYNEVTANVYTDVDLITADEELGADATQLFNYLMGFTEEQHWAIMKVAPFTLRGAVIGNIDNEIARAKAGEKAHIIMKLNSINDREIIEKLYEASSAGVKIDLIVRGISGLKAGVKNLSENIRVISIIGRFLEHARVLYFYNGGEPKYYITSADMMTRNLSGRVELMIEIIDEKFKQSLKGFLDISLMDNTKAWELHDNTYIKLTPPSGEDALSSQAFFLG